MYDLTGYVLTKHTLKFVKLIIWTFLWNKSIVLVSCYPYINSHKTSSFISTTPTDPIRYKKKNKFLVLYPSFS